MQLNDRQIQMCATSRWDFSDLKAVFLNCTLKPSPEPSNTEGLFGIAKAIFEKNGVEVETIRPVDHDIAFGVWPDMTEHGSDVDDDGISEAISVGGETPVSQRHRIRSKRICNCGGGKDRP